MKDDLSDGMPAHGRSSSEMPLLLSPKDTTTTAHKPRSHKRLSQIGRLEVVIMLLVFVIILQSVFMCRGSYCFGEPTGASDRSCSNRANSPVPEFRTYTQDFYNTTSEYGIWKVPWTEDEWMRWYKNWEALYPPGRGMVKVVNPGQYAGIPPPMDDFEGK
ncbi:hypothetical protein CKAH01_05884 [Colletotrichum kahawae]|uniref:Uncharacterized protein n=1 Tax=Colletotrichum kahawae TaxID=34407 RepID=A0AAD9YBZ2_COLKA|nr:hypothetical protein CKAH01_05884 [Colletotrichum kahawae]